ncbi:MAG: site-specific integrase, partial [bacterium]|nr:site-specific integrase [bacterium]
MLRIFQDFMYHLQGERQLAPNTVASYKNDILRYLQFLKERGINKAETVSEEMIIVYLESLSSIPLAPSSLARNLSAIRMFHRFMVNEAYCSKNVSENIDTPKLP